MREILALKEILNFFNFRHVIFKVKRQSKNRRQMSGVLESCGDKRPGKFVVKVPERGTVR